jgi:hypothetical protein
MADSYRSIGEDAESAVCWGAIFAGAFSAAAVTLILATLGIATGLALVSPWSGSSLSAGAFKITAGVYLVLAAMISSTIGGYMAGRLRTKWSGAPRQEVLFRDTAHGLVAWAFATLILVAVIGAGAGSLLGAGVTGILSGAGQATSQASRPSTDYFVDTLLRPAPNSGLAVQQSDPAAARREVGLIFSRDFASGSDFPSADRGYLTQVVASRTGLSQMEADKRVSDVIEQTKNYLDGARKYGIALSLWSTLSLLVGAFAASAGAIEGGQLRDGRWRGVLFAPRDELNTRSRRR